MTTLICRNERRREQVRQQSQLNGLDYLEVGGFDQPKSDLENQRFLRVYFLGKAPVVLNQSNVLVEGGRRIRDIHVEKVDVHQYESIDLDDYMEVTVNQAGDFSTYTLRVVEQNDRSEWQPHSAFDSRYDRIEFNFKADCPSDLDCKQEAVCPPKPVNDPDINYFAKDYGSFRQLILDRLALVRPDWNERHVPDIGITLVEVLAYVGDHLSYYQDAVATEAYLDTARKRISIRRHARLVDYTLHEGCNARAWVCVETDNDLPPLDPKQIYFITGFNESNQSVGQVLSSGDLRKIPSSVYEVFEPMGQEGIQFYSDHNKITFYTWNDQECCLPKGTTRATLVGRLIPESSTETFPCDPVTNSKIDDLAVTSTSAVALSAQSTTVEQSKVPSLHLKPGDVLIFEEIIGPETHHPGDADPKHRHAVCLTDVQPNTDRLNGQPVVEITWSRKDALPFPLCLSSLGPPPRCEIKGVSIACGNVILVDHGRTVDEDLGQIPEGKTIECCKAEGLLADQTIIPGNFRRSLQYTPLTFSQPLASETIASTTLTQDVRQALPQVSLKDSLEEAGASYWIARRDLLASGPEDKHFVVEMDNDGRAHLRFGDDELGEKPDAGLTFHGTYRIGNGLAGNVGAKAISHLVLRNGQLNGVAVSVRNPLPAQGGTVAEPVAEVKLFGPHTFRNELQRAITADDYATIVQREFKDQVQRAAARLRWSGSWYEILVTVDPYGQEEAEPELLEAIAKRLHRYRRVGHDLVVRFARRVPLDIEILVCVLPNYLRGHVKAVLLDLFGNRTLPDGRLGFFHPDNLTFGEGIYLSKLVAIAQAVEGVESVRVIKLQRQNELASVRP